MTTALAQQNQGQARPHLTRPLALVSCFSPWPADVSFQCTDKKPMKLLIHLLRDPSHSGEDPSHYAMTDPERLTL